MVAKHATENRQDIEEKIDEVCVLMIDFIGHNRRRSRAI